MQRIIDKFTTRLLYPVESDRVCMMIMIKKVIMMMGARVSATVGISGGY